MAGVQTEACSEGGTNVGWIDAGDWMAYAARSFTAGTYTFRFRVASLNGGGNLKLDLNAGATQLGSVSVPSTGGWQTWTTISMSVSIAAGTHSVGINAGAGGWNINWYEFETAGGTVATPTPATNATPTPTTAATTGTLWADEFNGSGLPNWNFDIGGGGWATPNWRPTRTARQTATNPAVT